MILKLLQRCSQFPVQSCGRIYFVSNCDFSHKITFTDGLTHNFLGRTLSVRVMKDERGRSRGFGFVNYANHEDAQKVVFLCLHLYGISYSTFKSDRFSRLFFLFRSCEKAVGPNSPAVV